VPQLGFDAGNMAYMLFVELRWTRSAWLRGQRCNNLFSVLGVPNAVKASGFSETDGHTCWWNIKGNVSCPFRGWHTLRRAYWDVFGENNYRGDCTTMSLQLFSLQLLWVVPNNSFKLKMQPFKAKLDMRMFYKYVKFNASTDINLSIYRDLYRCVI